MRAATSDAVQVPLTVMPRAESVVSVSKPHWIKAWPAAVLLALSLALWGYPLLSVSLLGLGLTVGAIHLAWLTRCEVVVTDKRIIIRTPIRTTRVEIEEIRDICVQQSLLGSWLNEGTVTILWNGPPPLPLVLAHVSDPFEIHNPIKTQVVCAWLSRELIADTLHDWPHSYLLPRREDGLVPFPGVSGLAPGR